MQLKTSEPYWLSGNVGDPEAFAEEMATVCDLYAEAPVLRKAGIHVVSTDEKSGIQALERKHPALPTKSGQGVL